jgi:hypothetical protein
MEFPVIPVCYDRRQWARQEALSTTSATGATKNKAKIFLPFVVFVASVVVERFSPSAAPVAGENPFFKSKER